MLIILGGSLLGVQLGAIGTTYVRPHMIKMVMATIGFWTQLWKPGTVQATELWS